MLKTNRREGLPWWSVACIRGLSMVMALIVFTTVQAQQLTVSGVVKDATGKPIEGGSVGVKGQPAGTLTDEKGRYSLKVPDTKSIIVFSSIGFTDMLVTVGTRKTVSPVMSQGSSNLEDVVVVGYGTQKKRDVTGAITSVNSAQITQRQPKDLADALQGLAPGLQIAQASGRPGADASIRIRGIGTLQGGADPLFIVDGAQGVDISGINPNDIESVEVLKDAASAAIYGSRSANGVIIITTKRGREAKPLIQVRYMTSGSQLSHKIQQVNAQERRLYEFKRSGGGNLNADSLNPSYNADNDHRVMSRESRARRKIR